MTGLENLTAIGRDLNIEDKSPSEALIKKKRNAAQKPLLVLMPFDPRISDDLDVDKPIIGFGVIIPEFDNEEKIEFAARIVDTNPEFEYSQNDDDIDSDD